MNWKDGVISILLGTLIGSTYATTKDAAIASVVSTFIMYISLFIIDIEWQNYMQRKGRNNDF